MKQIFISRNFLKYQKCPRNINSLLNLVRGRCFSNHLHLITNNNNNTSSSSITHSSYVSIRHFSQTSSSTSSFQQILNPDTDNNPDILQINNTRLKSEINPNNDNHQKHEINNESGDYYTTSSSSSYSDRFLDPKLYVDRIPGPDDDVWIGMSSGVDSSTAAALLAEKYNKSYIPSGGTGRVRGIFMANWSSTAKCTEADWNDVQKVCSQIGIECERVNFEKEYWQEVFEPMIEMYKQGMTPNPDVGCNRYIKFGSLIRYLSSKYESPPEQNSTTTSSGEQKNNKNKKWWLATGHYARVSWNVPTKTTHLLRPKHLPKDQSYYLSSISPNVLNHILFPLAHLTKPQVRELAKNKYDLPTADKPDSQGLCFVSQSQNTFRSFLDEYLAPNPGNIVIKQQKTNMDISNNKNNNENLLKEKINNKLITTTTKKIVGKHHGIWHATIGQKSGISVPQGDPETKGVWYVHSKDINKNEIVIVRGTNNPALFSESVKCDKFEWLGEIPSSFSFSSGSGEGSDLKLNHNDLFIQYRSLQSPEPVKSILIKKNELPTKTKTITKNEEEEKKNNNNYNYTVTIEFTTPRRAVAPGQYLVIYDGDRVLGSGIINSTKRIANPWE